jgi:restriction system protein
MKFEDLIPHIPADQKYWFIRTNKGDYYEDFVNEGFIGVGWNKIGLNDLNKNIPLSDIVKSNYPDQKQNLVANQIIAMAKTMKKGDIVLIPSEKSRYIHFGIVADDEAYEENIPIELEEIDDHPELEFNYEGACPYRKRRKVNWIEVRRRDHLDPQLFKLIYSQRTISDATENYAEFIDRALYDFYIKGDKCHLVLHVTKEGNIKGRHLVPFMADILNIAETNSKDDEDVDLKVSVQSPGTIELIGWIPEIIVASMVIVGVLGGRAKFIGFEIDTPGIIGRVLEFMGKGQSNTVENNPVGEQQNIPESQKQRLVQNAENLGVKLPQNLEKAVSQYVGEINKELSPDEKQEESKEEE